MPQATHGSGEPRPLSAVAVVTPSQRPADAAATGAHRGGSVGEQSAMTPSASRRMSWSTSRVIVPLSAAAGLAPGRRRASVGGQVHAIGASPLVPRWGIGPVRSERSVRVPPSETTGDIGCVGRRCCSTCAFNAAARSSCIGGVGLTAYPSCTPSASADGRARTRRRQRGDILTRPLCMSFACHHFRPWRFGAWFVALCGRVRFCACQCARHTSLLREHHSFFAGVDAGDAGYV